MRYTLFLGFFLLLLYIIYFIKLKPNHNYTISLHYPANNSNQTLIWIHNTNNYQVKFNFSLNNKFYASINDFILKNTKSTETELQLIDIFEAFTQSVVHEKLFNQWGALPLVRINSLGFAICGRQSEIFVHLANVLKLKGRILHLNGHAVSEIYFQKKWYLFDPDRKVFFTKNHRPISTDEFISKADSFIQSFIPQKISHLSVYNTKYKEMFITKNDNVIQSIEKSKNDTFLLTLPPKASLVFPFPPDYKTDFYPYNSKAKLFLPKNFSGTIQNPLVLIDAEGSGIIIYNKRSYKIPEQRELLKLAIFNSKKFIDEVKVEVKSDSLSLVYALNPLFTKFEKSNNFVLNASDTLIVKIIQRKSISNSEVESIHLEQLNHYVKEAFEILKTIDISHIHTLDQLYVEQIFPYCKSKNIDSLLVKNRFNLIKPLIQEPIKNFKNESNFYAYLAIIIYGKNYEFNALFLTSYRYFQYKNVAKRFYSSKYFE